MKLTEYRGHVILESGEEIEIYEVLRRTGPGPRSFSRGTLLYLESTPSLKAAMVEIDRIGNPRGRHR